MKHKYFHSTAPTELDALKEEWMKDIRENAFGRVGRSCEGQSTIGTVWERREEAPKHWMGGGEEAGKEDVF